MSPERIKELKSNYWMKERNIGPYLILSGKFNYDSYLKWTMEFHIEQFVYKWEIVCHTIHGNDLLQLYSVIMRRRQP